jgi:hypothetical protein
MPGKRCVRWFSDVRPKDIAEVGGKSASLGDSMRCSRLPCALVWRPERRRCWGSGTQLCRRSDVERLYADSEYLRDA